MTVDIRNYKTQKQIVSKNHKLTVWGDDADEIEHERIWVNLIFLLYFIRSFVPLSEFFTKSRALLFA